MFQPYKENEEHNFWISYADLVTGFMIIFIVITMILFNRQIPVPHEPEPIIEIPPVDTVSTEENSIGVLKKQFEEAINSNPELKKVIEITDDAIIRFTAEKGEELFKEGEPDPTKYFQKKLDKFLPYYFKIIQDFKKKKSNKFQIIELRIEGHTDSKGDYYDNLELSSGRALRVQKHILNSRIYKKNATRSFRKFIEQYTVALGYSETKLLDRKGRYISKSKRKEYYDKSRRVEFRVLIEKKDN